MVWPILISLSVTPGAFCAAADIAMAPLSSNEPNNIRNTARSRSRTAGCCALTASCELAAAPPTRLTKSHRFIPSPRRQSGGAGGRGAVPTTQASLSHFFMKLFLAAPESFLPSELTAFGAHASRLHFFRKLLSAAPASGLPFLSIALLAHVSCAMAGPIAKAAIMAAKIIRFMGLPPVGEPVVYSKNSGSQHPRACTLNSHLPPATNSAGAFRRTPAGLPERRRLQRRCRNSPPPHQCRAGNRDRWPARKQRAPAAWLFAASSQKHGPSPVLRPAPARPARSG